MVIEESRSEQNCDTTTVAGLSVGCSRALMMAASTSSINHDGNEVKGREPKPSFGTYTDSDENPGLHPSSAESVLAETREYILNSSDEDPFVQSFGMSAHELALEFARGTRRRARRPRLRRPVVQPPGLHVCRGPGDSVQHRQWRVQNSLSHDQSKGGCRYLHRS